MSTGTGVNVSKANAYAVLSKPAGINVSKANAYAVLTKPAGINVSKVCVYVVLTPVNSNPPAWPSFSFGNAVVEQAYMQAFDLQPAASPVTFSIVDGALPDGLTLNSLGGTMADISGTPTKLGTYNFTIRASNVYGTKDKQFTITVSLPTLGTQVAMAFG